MTGQPVDVHQQIAELARELRANDDSSEVVDALTAHAALQIPGAEVAGITLTTERRHVETASTTDKVPAMLDDIQRRHGEGPCLSAAWDHHTIRVDDLAADDRWPAFVREALADTPVRSILSFQLFTVDRTMGALNVFASRPNAFSDEAEEVGYLLATHVALAWEFARRGEQFRSALASRDVIGQAKGIIMERFGVGAVRAFELLKRLSQESNTPLVDVARKVTVTIEDQPTHI